MVIWNAKYCLYNYRVRKQMQCSLNFVIYANYLKEMSSKSRFSLSIHYYQYSFCHSRHIQIVHKGIKKAVTKLFVTA